MIVGAPDKGKNTSYTRFSAEDIAVYLPKNVKTAPEGIHISLKGISILRQLVVGGIRA
ncbi:hypothetical protein [Metallumcola ferriviriculae]|uniref:hypothetical protein n=1 Tax=Metallumcola ferriviriculae TaxID=3039180 RepID=UPI003459D644